MARRADRRSFDCASRDETARGSAQDDTFYINPSLTHDQSITYAQAICRYCLAEFVGFGGSGDGVGEFGWVDGGGSGEAFAGYVADVEELAGEAAYVYVADVGVFDVCKIDAFGAGAGDVGEG